MQRSILAATAVLAVLLVSPASLIADELSRGVTGPAPGDAPALRIGRQYLVVIAISRYAHWPALRHPVVDARQIRDILTTRYCIDEVRELYDEEATKASIIKLLADLQEKLTADDSLLIVYCGHGYLDRKSNTGFWIPVNAGTDVYEQLNWLPHAQLKGLISNLPATHVLLVSDSCFAGDLLTASRSMPPSIDAEYFQKAYGLVSRQVLTSGAEETVPDVSDFASQLKSALARNQSPQLDALMLYNEVRLGMKATIPLLGALAGTGHQEGASFLLFLKGQASTVARRSGTVDVASGSDGVLFLDGVRYGEINAGTLRLTDVDVGEHTVRLDTADGLSTVRTVVVNDRRTQRVTFPSGAIVRGGSVWAGGGLGAVIPIGDASALYSPGRFSTRGASEALYGAATPVGWLGAGVWMQWGGLASSTGPEMYMLRSILVGPVLRYQTLLPAPFFVAVDLAAGIAPTQVVSVSPELDGTSFARPFLAPSLQIGWILWDRLRISAGLGCPILFLDTVSLAALTPMLEIAYAIVVPHAARPR